jgi:pyruvate dehydrogenase E2 component (dihydrolipoamide acetyltransferase)
MTLSLSFDHRAVDGADAARFLGTLAKNVNGAVELLVRRGG